MKIGNSYLSFNWGDILISPNKSFEYQFEFGKNSNFDLFELSLKWSTKQDHAGISFVFTIRKIIFMSLKIYDHRHWDRNNNCWIKQKINN